MKFIRTSVHDPGINNIEAVNFLIPSGWKAEGEIKWFPEYSILANLLVTVSDPQTRCPDSVPAAPELYLDATAGCAHAAGHELHGKHLLATGHGCADVCADVFRAAGAAAPARRAAGQREGSAQDRAARAEKLRDGFTGKITMRPLRISRQGRAALAGGCLSHARIQRSQRDHDLVGHLRIFLPPPAGKLDEMTPLMATSINTLRLTPDWYAGYMYVQKLFMDRQNQGIKNAKALSDTITRNSEEIRQMFADSYKQQQESQDRISQSWSETIRGVNTYKNPYEDRPVELPSGYDHAWVNAKGEYLLTNEMGLDPNVGDTTEWRKMEQRGQ